MGNRNFTILLIDDVQDNLTTLRALIQEIFPNAAVFQALNGKLGLEIAKKENPDVILLDIVMPGMDGFEVCDNLKKDEELREIPVVFITALKGDKGSRIRALECGAEAFLAKPIDIYELTAQIQSMVKIRDANKQKLDENVRLVELVKKKTEELTKENFDKEEINKALLEAQRIAHIGSFKRDVANDEMIWTQEALRIYGVDDPEKIKTLDCINRFFHPDDRQRIAEITQQAIREHRTVTCQHRIIREDGEERSVELRFTPVFDQNDRYYRSVGTIQDITERKLAEALLKESEEKFRYLFDHSAVGKSLTLLTGRTEYNSTMCQMLGFTAEELEGKKWQEITHPDDVESSEREMSEVLSGSKESIQFSKRYIRKDGSIMWADVFSTMRRAADGTPMYFMTSIIDITERKKTQEALKQSEERFQLLFNKAPLGYQSLDSNGCFIDVNQQWLDTLGYARDEVIGRWFGDFLCPEYRDRFRQRFPMFKAKGQIHSEFEMLCKDGRRLFLSFEGKIAYDTDGTFKQTHCILQDVTEQRKAELALVENEEKYRLLYTSMSQGLALHEIVTDENGKPVDYIFLDINESYTRMLGVTREMCIGKRITEVMPKVEQYWIDVFGKVALTGEPMYYENFLETTGGYYGTYTYSPRMRQFAVLVSDITEKKKYEENLKHLSYHDQLTNLYNRRFFEEELARLDQKQNLPISIMMADINGLKVINDSFGHAVGDDFLIQLAEILKSTCRENEIIARLGGDEFVVILPKTDVDETAKIVKRLKDIISETRIGNIDLSVSFGFDTKENEDQSIEDILASAENHMYTHKIAEHSSMRGNTVGIIMNALIEKSAREAEHSQRVSEICEEIATKMNFDHDEVEQIKVAGLVHDIGKIGINEAILNKAGHLEKDEWMAIRRHPEAGWRILSTTLEFSEVALFVLHHHEKFDGSGYPDGLKREEIPIQARIIAIADAYDAMTNERSYKGVISHEEAIKEIKRCSGTHFDPAVVEAYLR